MISIEQLNFRLSEQAFDVAKYLLPNGKRHGNEWCVGSIHGEAGKSLRICVEGTKKGVWSDFATNESGKLFRLWMLTRKINASEARKEVQQWLCIPEINLAPLTQNNFKNLNLKKMSALKLNSNVSNYLIKQRKLSWETLNHFQLSEENDFIVFPYFRDEKLLQTKKLHIHRINGHKKIYLEKNCEPSLFGWQAIANNLNQITLTEGEIDTLSLYEYGIASLSLPFGGGSGNKHRWLDYEFDHLRPFEKIYLCFDQDDVGQQTVHALLERLGRHRCFVVTLPFKDANECLQQGVSKTVIQHCFENAVTFDPDELKPANHFTDHVIDLFYLTDQDILGYVPPWKKAQAYLRFRPNELSLWTGINGHGKSQFMGHLMAAMMQQGARVCVASLEIKPERLLQRLTRQVTACELPDQNLIQKAHAWYADKLWLFDLVGTAKTERLLEVFLYARQRYGIDVFLIDSLLKCNIAEDDYQSQKAFVEQLCDFKNSHPCHIHLIAHPRKGCDEKQLPGKLDIKGTGSVSDLADNCFVIWRNKEKEHVAHQAEAEGMPLEAKYQIQPDCVWACDKNRNGEWEGRLSFWFDKLSLQYLEAPNSQPQTIIHLNQTTETEDFVIDHRV